MRYFIIISIFISACSSDDVTELEFTGNELVYDLTVDPQYYNGEGTVTFKERTDQGLTIDISMDATGSGGLHPAHLHYGTFDVPDAEMAVMLNPVDASTGNSTTTVYKLLDGSNITYSDILRFDGSIKVHMDDGPNKSIVLAATNIGSNASMDISGIAVCSSEGKTPA